MTRHATEPTAIRLPSPTARTLRGLAAAAAMTALLAGLPLLLVAIFGWPPDLPSQDQLAHPHLATTAILTGALAVLGWAAWAWLLFALAREVAQAIRWGIDPAALRDAASPARWAAGLLVGAVAALWPTATQAGEAPPAETAVNLALDDPARAGATPSGAHLVWRSDTAPDQTAAAPAATTARTESTSDGESATDPATALRVVTVGPENPTLWDIAGKYLGDPTRYMEIFELNKHRDFEGGPFDDPADINHDWQLLIPDNEPAEATDPDENAATIEPTDPDDMSPDNEDPSTGTDTDPGTGDDGPVPEPGDSDTTDPAAPETADAATEPAPPADDHEPSTAEGLHAVPTGIWLTAGTCLAAAAIGAILVKTRRGRPGDHQLDPNESFTGRLSDMEAIIEREQRRITEPVPLPEPANPVTVDTDPDENLVDLRALAAGGVGLLGPGQRSAARAAIIAAVAADATVHVTAAADLRLDITNANAETTPAISEHESLDAALMTAAVATGGDILIVCADTEIEPGVRDALEQFLQEAPHKAVVLGDWEPSAITLAADGTITNRTGRAEATAVSSLDIADPAATIALLERITDSETAAASDSPEPAPPPQPEPPLPAQAVPSQEDQAPPGPLRLCMFGVPDVYLGEKSVPLKKGRRARAFLAALMLADEPLPLSALLQAVLGKQDDLARARNNLNSIGSAVRGDLRKATASNSQFYHYDKQTETYELEREHFTSDVAEFDDAEQAAATTEDPHESARQLEAAIAVYTGDLMPEIDTEEIRQLRAQYQAAAHRACLKLADYHAEQGNTSRARWFQDKAAVVAEHRDAPAQPLE